LTSSRLLFSDGQTARPSDGGAAAASLPTSSQVAFATPIPVGGHVQWIFQAQDGSYRIREADVKEVCPNPGDPCSAGAPVEDQPAGFTTEPQTVFGAQDGS